MSDVQQHARELMLRVLKQYPNLTAEGFDSFWPAKMPLERQAQFDLDRADLLTLDSLAAFVRAIEWLSQFDTRKSFNPHGTSYGLKHVAEPEIGYTTNGCFIAAAVAAGFNVRQAEMGSKNALLNICTEAWHRGPTIKEHERLAAAVGRAYKAAEEIESILRDEEVTDWSHKRLADRAVSALSNLGRGLSRPKGQRRRWERLIELYGSEMHGAKRRWSTGDPAA